MFLVIKSKRPPGGGLYEIMESNINIDPSLVTKLRDTHSPLVIRDDFVLLRDSGYRTRSSCVESGGQLHFVY